MAPDVRRWLLVAVLGCATYAVAYLPPQATEPKRFLTNASPELRYEERIAAALNQTRRLVVETERARHLLQQVQARRPEPAELQVVFRSRFPDAIARELRFRVDSVLRAAVPGPLATPVVFVFYGEASGSYLVSLPRGRGEACGASLPTDVTLDPRHRTVIMRIQLALTVCSYYAAFGLPGPAIEQWLRGRRYDVASSVVWSDVPDADLDRALERPPLSVWLTGSQMYFMMSNAPAEPIACAIGQLDRCRQDILRTTTGSDEDFLADGRVLLTPRFWARRPESTWLAELVREMGRDRFTRFWQSDQPVERAFADAFGADLGAWTANWRGRQHAFLPGTTRLSPLRFLEGVLAMVLLAGAAALVAERRRIQ